MPEADDPVASLIAGFIVWLAEQRYKRDYRYRCAVVTEQYLRWQTRRRQQQLPSHLNAYCRERAIGGVCDDKLNDIRHIIGDFDKFFRATS